MLTENVPNAAISAKLLNEKDFDIRQFYQNAVQNSEKSEYFLLCEQAPIMFERILAQLQLVEAAGGLVKNEQRSYLFIYRNGIWDLPKGKIDEGERPEAAAVREVEEECGVEISWLGDLISVTYHIYATPKNLVLKRTYWYEMSVLGIPELFPQTEEGITKAVWLSANEMDGVKANTYPLISDLLKEQILS